MQDYEDCSRIVAVLGGAIVLPVEVVNLTTGGAQSLVGWEVQARAGKRGAATADFALEDLNAAGGTFALALTAEQIATLYAAHPEGCKWSIRYRTGPADRWQIMLEPAPFDFAPEGLW